MTAETPPIITPAATNHTTGVLLVVVSSLVFSTAGIFTKGVAADAWSVIFWRGLSAALISMIFLTLTGGLRDEIRRLGMPAILIIVVGASGTAAFIPAFKLTSVTNVVLIWATAPFIAAFLAWVTIRERPSKRTLIASLLALVGVGITILGSVGTGNLIGDALAAWMTLMMAGIYVIYRVWPDTPTVIPAALSSVVLLPPALAISDPLSVVPAEIWILIAFGFVFAVASVTLLEGARRIPASQTALLGALETPLAPLWAFLVLAEVPTKQAIIGGAIVMIAVVFSQMRQSSSRT